MASPSSITGGLLIIARNPADLSVSLCPSKVGQEDVSVVLIHDAVGATGISASSVHVLEDDLRSRGQTSPYAQISYSGLVHMLFDAKRVIVL